MLCLQCRALPSALRTVMRSQMTKLPSQTSISSLSSQLRPFSSAKLSQPTTLMTQSLSSLRTSLTSTPSMALNPALAQQTRSFSASASLAGRRATYNPSRRVQKRRHGFLARLKSRGGRRILAHRRSKGKKALSW